MTYWGNISHSMWVRYGLQHESDEGKVDIVGGQSVKVNLTQPSMHM